MTMFAASEGELSWAKMHGPNAAVQYTAGSVTALWSSFVSSCNSPCYTQLH